MDTTCIDKRVTETLRRLEKTDGAYALAVEQSRELRWILDEIAGYGHDITISAGDCDNLNEYLTLQVQREDAASRAVYRQGFRDCVRLLKDVGVLT